MRWPSERPIWRPKSGSALADVTVSAGLFVAMALSLLGKPGLHGQHGANAGAFLLSLGLAAPYAFHRRAPYPATAVCLGSLFVYSAIGYPAFPGINAFVLLFGIALHHDRTRSGVTFLATAAVLLAAAVIQPSGVVDGSSATSTALATVVAWLAGDNLRQRRARWLALRERNQMLEREREEKARQAVIQERLRIARELHDVVAHAMSVIAVQSGVGSHIGAEHPAQAQRALAAIETTSRSALTEMRRLLGVLRQEGDDLVETSPSPSLADVPGLIRHAAGGGLTATLQIDGTPTALPPGMELSAYRIVQEALTNAIKHGGSRALVRVSYTSDEVTVEVTNDAAIRPDRSRSDEPQGHGIIGMRERAAMFGGVFTAAPAAGGGFAVRARLPLDGELQ